VNTQHRGQYAKVTVNLTLENGDTLKPFLRYTHLGDSNSVVMNGQSWMEPESHRWQAGVIWKFAAP
jgi:hypothetical protein